MGTVLIILLVVVVIAVIYSMMTKTNHEKGKDRIQPVSPKNEKTKDIKVTSSYKNEYVELADIVPVAGLRAEGPMDTFTTFIAGIGRYCNQGDIGYIIGRVMPEPNNEYNPNAMVIKDLDGKKLSLIHI